MFMENNKLSDVNSKSGSELIAIAHGIAANFESPATELLRELASRLECSIIRGDELQQKLDALAAENASLKESVEHAAGCIHAAEVEGLKDVLESRDGERLYDLVHRRLCHAYLPVETPATDAHLNSVRAEGVDLVKSHPAISLVSLTHICDQIAEQLRSGTHDTADKAG
ncbi:hypothetical protein [Pantoea ananatis]|uniref:hypothetical protein n=1 Tax=Pantoea ananas TaxID=553 RepID=UPI001B30AD52|nr:hypothetical protein [Pantoea ananatis]